MQCDTYLLGINELYSSVATVTRVHHFLLKDALFVCISGLKEVYDFNTAWAMVMILRINATTISFGSYRLSFNPVCRAEHRSIYRE
jgi:hypothetical protein